MSSFLEEKDGAVLARATVGTKKDFYNALVIGTRKYNIKKLLVMQKTTPRAATNRKPTEHISLRLKKMYQIQNDVRIKSLTFTHKAIHGPSPEYIK